MSNTWQTLLEFGYLWYEPLLTPAVCGIIIAIHSFIFTFRGQLRYVLGLGGGGKGGGIVFNML